MSDEYFVSGVVFNAVEIDSQSVNDYNRRYSFGRTDNKSGRSCCGLSGAMCVAEQRPAGVCIY